MANEILYSGLGDQRLTEVLSGEYLLQLADRNALPNHPALFYAGDAMGKGSLVTKVPIVNFGGYDQLAAVGEGATIANTALGDSSVTVTVGRYGKAYTVSDIARFSTPMAGGLRFDAASFAQDAITAQAMTLTSLIAGLVDNFATTAGTSGVNASLADFLSARNTLRIANVQGPLMAVLHSRQWADISDDIALAVGGTVQFRLDPAAQMLRGQSYQGNLLDVDVFVSNQVISDGTDRKGGIFGRGAIIWADSTIEAEGDPNMIIIGGKILLEREREARASTTAWVSTSHLGVVEGIDLAGVTLATDA